MLPVLLGIPVLQDPQDPQDRPVLLVLQDRLVPQVLLGQRGLMAQRAPLVLLVQPALLGQLEQQEQQARPDLPERQVLPGQQAQMR